LIVIESFSKVPNLNLHVSGFAVDIDDNTLRSECHKYKNIHYYGNVSFDRYIELLHQCPFLLSTRDPRIIENQCNFPSKVIEGILHNRIIVSTIHYAQLKGLNYFEVPSEIDSLVSALEQISTMSPAELKKYANQSDYAKTNYSPNEWKKAMSLIESKKN
jgi:hypothetical protein